MDADGLFNSSSSDRDKEPLCSRLLHSIGIASENMPRSSCVKRYENMETVSELDYGVWGDTDAALNALKLLKTWVDPFLYKNFVLGKRSQIIFCYPDSDFAQN